MTNPKMLMLVFAGKIDRKKTVDGRKIWERRGEQGSTGPGEGVSAWPRKHRKSRQAEL